MVSIIELKNPFIVHKSSSIGSAKIAVAEWFRLWMFNMEAPRSNASRFLGNLSHYRLMLMFCHYSITYQTTKAMFRLYPQQFSVSYDNKILVSISVINCANFACI